LDLTVPSVVTFGQQQRLRVIQRAEINSLSGRNGKKPPVIIFFFLNYFEINK
jgi:hypothetical protein